MKTLTPAPMLYRVAWTARTGPDRRTRYSKPLDLATAQAWVDDGNASDALAVYCVVEESVLYRDPDYLDLRGLASAL